MNFRSRQVSVKFLTIFSTHCMLIVYEVYIQKCSAKLSMKKVGRTAMQMSDRHSIELHVPVPLLRWNEIT